jgi:ADP-heptose:LPS heptosyltransferase
MMTGVAILKPDHLGDLVLSVPAIRAIRARHTEVTLFVGPSSLGLARYLFPDITNIHPAPLAHLIRGTGNALKPEALAGILDGFEFVFCLRHDPVMQAISDRLHVCHVLAIGDHLTHETDVQRRALAPVIGDYSRTVLFGDVTTRWPLRLDHVALCIAAGFPTNRWPNTYWLELARRLAALGLMVTLVGGPAEREDLIALSRMLVRVPHQVIEGGADVGAFLDALAGVDLVVASDGGTAHLCSLRKPIVSLFGSSPWRRYAPFGAHNVLLTRDEPCSPCVQFSANEVNGCMTRECTALLRPRQVERVVLSNGIDFSGMSGVRVERGVSHRTVP